MTWHLSGDYGDTGLGVQPAEKAVMACPPHPPHEGILARGMGRETILIGLLMELLTLGVGAWYYFGGHANWQTMIFTSLAFAQTGQVLAVRSGQDTIHAWELLSNPLMLVMICTVIFLQMLVVYLPPLQSFFSTQNRDLPDLLVTAGVGEFVFFFIEAAKIEENERRNAMKITVTDMMQTGYEYHITEPEGENFHPDFQPDLTPAEMLAMGVFGGKYMTDCRKEYPEEWFRNARLCHERHVPELNYFGVNASQPLAVWRAKGWIFPEDPRGWFQWYCRYFLGRRCPDDPRQIGRWRAMQRHIAQVRKNCPAGILACRRKQRQALLHWAYDSRNF